MKKALILGIGGQDGIYLTKHLAGNGYQVLGTSRTPNRAKANLTISGISKKRVNIVKLETNKQRDIENILKQQRPDEVYNLSGVSSVGYSIRHPLETYESIACANQYILEYIRKYDKGIKYFMAGSTECFGDTGVTKANEDTRFNPLSPYACAKAAAFWQVKTYRKMYDMFCCTGILSNHESEIRRETFVTQKIIKGVRSIRDKQTNILSLGDLAIKRDWGWAAEYVEAMNKMLISENAKDYIIATGKSITLKEYAEIAFEKANLVADEHIQVDENIKRRNEGRVCSVDPGLIERDLGWKAKIYVDEVIERMWLSEIKEIAEKK